MSQPKIGFSQIDSRSAADVTTWDDIVSPVIVRGSGTNDPAFSAIPGFGNMRAHEFIGATTMKEVWFMIHVGHDYAAGTDVHVHVHWLTNDANTTNSVLWQFEYAYAKGHQQQAFRNIANTVAGTTTVSVAQPSPGAYYHNIAEVALGFTNQLEPDTIIYIRMFRDPTHVSDTATYSAFVLATDVHFQKNRIGTKNRAPNFNT